MAGLGTYDANGWTDLVPTTGRMIYVSSSIGSDSYDGFSGTVDGGGVGPKATINAARLLLRSGYPDWLHLKCGDTWTNEILYPGYSGLSVTEPLVITSYGTGARPVLIGEGMLVNTTSPDVWQYAYIGNIEIRGTRRDAPYNTSGAGLLILENAFHITIEGMLITGCYDGVSWQRSDGTTGDDGYIEIRRNIIHDNTHQGVLMVGNVTTVTFEENIITDNGFDVDRVSPSILTHNLYTKIKNYGTFRNNIIANASNFGLKMSADDPNGIQNITVENNLFLNSPMSMDHSAGASGDTDVTFTHNVGSITDNVFISFDRMIGQDIAFYAMNTNAITFDGNIWAHKSTTVNAMFTLDNSEHHENLTVQNSIVYDWAVDSAPEDYFQPNSAFVDNYVLTNNQIDQSAGSYTDPERTVGTYYQSIGGTNSSSAFLTAARAMTKATWSAAYMADAVNDYIRAGFDVGTPTYYAFSAGGLTYIFQTGGA